MSSTILSRPPAPAHHAVFASVLCALDDRSANGDARRQAAWLAGSDGLLELYPTASPAAVRERARRHSLVVLGEPGLASEMLETAPLPVLLSRRPPSEAFGESVLVAVDADPSCVAAADVAARVAAAARGRVAIVAAPRHDAATCRALADASARVRAILHVDPIVLDENGESDRAIVAAARAVEASLIVTGSRGPGSPGSVSARVALAAPCSVLVMRAPRCG